jgi:hypothetical protein
LTYYPDAISHLASTFFPPSIQIEHDIVDMSATVFLGLKALSQTLTPQEALSGIFGSISLATWIFLLVWRVALN